VHIALSAPSGRIDDKERSIEACRDSPYLSLEMLHLLDRYSEMLATDHHIAGIHVIGLDVYATKVFHKLHECTGVIVDAPQKDTLVSDVYAF
jgi:hypothetical protein